VSGGSFLHRQEFDPPISIRTRHTATYSIDPCYFWDVSYQYYGWALNERHYLIPGADSNAYPVDSNNISGGFLAQLPHY
jgi:hypothetical protein